MGGRFARRAAVAIERLTPDRIEDLGAVLRGSWGRGCWCMYPRLTPEMEEELPGAGSMTARRREAMTALAGRETAPGLLAYEGDRPVGWVAIAPRSELVRLARSRATPPVDQALAWVIPCITVAPAARGRGIAVAMIRAAVAFAREHGAEAVEAYPRASSDRVDDDSAFYGTQRLFARAGFRVVRKPLAGVPKNWTPRVAMRAR